MNQNVSLKDVSIGILTWRTPETLTNTLESYEKTGFLDMVGEVSLFLNETHPNDVEIAKRFGINTLFAQKNIGIGPAIKDLVRNASKPYFMFLENDWLLIENQETVRNRLATGLALLQSDTVDVVRFRHRRRYGEPLHSRVAFEGNELPLGKDHLLDSIHWRSDPSELFPTYIKKKIIGDEKWFFASSECGNYTNNPCLYERSFLEENILQHAFGDGIALEADIHNWWRNQEFRVAQGEGLFEHRPLEISGTGYNFWPRLRRYLKSMSVRRTS